VFTAQRWQDVRQKNLSGSPAFGIFYDHAWAAGLGTITVYPKPTNNTTSLVIWCPTALTSIALATSYTWPPGVERAIQYNVAAELLPQFPTTPDRAGLILRMAAESLAIYKRTNYQPMELTADGATMMGSDARRAWNINAGQWAR
jgi:hypothetical protein